MRTTDSSRLYERETARNRSDLTDDNALGARSQGRDLWCDLTLARPVLKFAPGETASQHEA